MYNMPYYKEENQQVLLNFMRQHSFAMLIGCADEVSAVTQIPFLIEERENKIFLKGHFMRQTDHHKAFEKNANVLCVFTGPHAYVSASLYTNPQTASTWNYMSVHVKGQLVFLKETELLSILEEMTGFFERDENSPASFKKLPPDYVSKLSKAIIGFEIEAKQIDAVFKLSQNRDKHSYENIIHHLEEGDENAIQIATEMRYRKEKLFGDTN